MYAMIYDDDKKFAMRKASYDEAILIAARTLADTSFEMWDPECSKEEYDQWLLDHGKEIINTVGVEKRYAPRSVGYQAIKYHQFHEESVADLNKIMMEAIQINGRSVSRVCLFCCEELHGVSYQKGINNQGNTYIMQTHEWKMSTWRQSN